MSGTYSVTTGSEAITGNNFLSLELSNPPSSGKKARILKIFGGSTNNLIINLFRNGSIPPTRTVTPINTDFELPNESKITAFFSPNSDVSGGSAFATILQTGGSQIVEFDKDMIHVPPGKTFVIRLKNNAGSSQILSAGIIWRED